jgi:molybdate transport system permease protein
MRDMWYKDKFHIILVLVTYFVALFTILALSTVVFQGLTHFGKTLFCPEIAFAIRLSLYTSTVSTLMCILFAIPTAYVLARMDIPCNKLLNTILDLPLAIPHLVSGFCILLLFGTTGLGTWLESMGVNIVFSPNGIILVQIFVNLPFMIRVMKSTILSVSPRLEFVARTLGCTPAQSFFKVTLPLSRNGIIAGTVITWARALGEFGGALIVAGATRFRTETLPVSLFLNMTTGDIGAAMAAANILIAISLVSLFVFNKLGGDFIGGTRGL